ncbi:MAG TPA: Nif3-like dinuclear metal center hexameric protein [Bryobacteraceae bacterium]|jgi:putative NIF3 family GTP cyclohydrolase 1 type 2|nr:Nif3-like dinuclear metal center hexameric protein [Bryobacteraceae bacterium]
MDRISRRGLLFAGAGLALGDAGPSASQVIEKIKQNVGVPWRTETVDRFVAGDPETPVKGIATTMMATLDVLQRSAAAGKNLVITHEPTFWLHQDTTAEIEQNAAYQFKRDFIRKNNMAVWRFHDHWHAHKPDGIATGMARELGWEKNADPEHPRMFTFSAMPLSRFAKEIQTRLNIRAMRVVGDPNLTIKRVAANWGYASRDPGIQMLARPEVDALIVGEAREWEVVEYAQDAIAAGQKKALLVLGHVVSEQAGMKYCAEWLRTFVTDVPIEFIAAAEPFWSPA